MIRPLAWLLHLGWLAGFALLVQWSVGWPQLLSAWSGAALGATTPLVLAGAWALMLASYALRALRLRDHFSTTHAALDWLACWKLTLLHNAANVLLPLRAGELSFPLLMQRYFGINAWQSVPALLWMRLLDLFVVLWLGALMALLLWPELPGRGGWIALGAVLWGAPMLAWAGKRRLRRGLQARLQPDSRWLAMLDALPGSGAAFWRSYLLTWANWLTKLAALGWLLAALLPAPLAAGWIGAIGGDLTSVLPLHAPAGVGTYQAGVVAALLPFGHGAAGVAMAATNLQLFLLAGVCLGGGIGLLLPRASGSGVGRGQPQ